MRSAGSVTSYGAPWSAAIASRANQSACGPASRAAPAEDAPVQRRDGAAAVRRYGRARRRVRPRGGRPCGARRPSRPPSPLGRCVDALPSTGGTAMPPRTQSTRGRPTAPRRSSRLAGRERRRGPERDRRAEVGSADRDHAAASVRNVPPGSVISSPGAPSGLPTRRLPMRSDSGRRRRTPRRRARRSRPPEVLHRRQQPGVDDGERHVRVCSSRSSSAPIGTKRPGRPAQTEPAGRGRRRRAQRRAADEPPAARSRERVDRRSGRRRSRRCPRGPRPRRREPRRRETPAARRDKGSPGDEAEEAHDVRRRGVDARDLGRREAVKPRRRPRGPARRRRS